MIRSGNEDNFAVHVPYPAERGLFVVADGMGGHAAGEVASEMAVQTLERELADIKDLEDASAAERVADALLGVKRFSPRVVFLGSYPRADKVSATTRDEHDNEAFREARGWLQGIISGERS